jgi:hypothetical protein
MPPPGGVQRTENMVIPPWSKAGAGSSGTVTRRGTNSASLRKEIDDQSHTGRNVLMLSALFLVALIFGARQYDLLDGTPIQFLAKKKADPFTESATSERRPAGGTPVTANPATNPVSQAKPSPDQGFGVIVLQSRFSDLRVLVNGQPVAVRNNQFSVPMNVALTIDVTKRGYQSVQFHTEVKDRAPVPFKVDMAELPGGTLSLVTTPDAQVTIFNGEEVVFTGRTPFRQKLPVGRYRVQLENNLLNYKGDLDVVIELNKITQLERVLK